MINVGSLVGRGREIVAMCCIKKMNYRIQGCTTIVSKEEKHEFWYNRCEDNVNKVDVKMGAELLDCVIEIEGDDDRRMTIIMVIGRKI